MKRSKAPTRQNDLVLQLTENEKESPILVFAEFFSSFHLQEVREDLWLWFCAIITTDSGWVPDGQSRSNILFLYKNLEKLIEAAYVFHQKQHTNQRKAKH